MGKYVLALVKGLDMVHVCQTKTMKHSLMILTFIHIYLRNILSFDDSFNIRPEMICVKIRLKLPITICIQGVKYLYSYLYWHQYYHNK